MHPPLIYEPDPLTTPTCIAYSEQCQFNFNGGNELELDAITAVHADPAIYRIGSTILINGGGGGVWCADHIPNGPGSRRVQMVMEHWEQSETVRGQEGNPRGSWNVFANDGYGEDDGNMVRMMRLDPVTDVDPRDGVTVIEALYFGEPQWESLIRQLQARTGSSAAVPPPTALNKIVSLDTRLELDVQNADAPNCVLYMDGHPLWDSQSTTARLNVVEQQLADLARLPDDLADLTLRVVALEHGRRH